MLALGCREQTSGRREANIWNHHNETMVGFLHHSTDPAGTLNQSLRMVLLWRFKGGCWRGGKKPDLLVTDIKSAGPGQGLTQTKHFNPSLMLSTAPYGLHWLNHRSVRVHWSKNPSTNPLPLPTPQALSLSIRLLTGKSIHWRAIAAGVHVLNTLFHSMCLTLKPLFLCFFIGFVKDYDDYISKRSWLLSGSLSLSHTPPMLSRCLIESIQYVSVFVLT